MDEEDERARRSGGVLVIIGSPISLIRALASQLAAVAFEADAPIVIIDNEERQRSHEEIFADLMRRERGNSIIHPPVFPSIRKTEDVNFLEQRHRALQIQKSRKMRPYKKRI